MVERGNPRKTCSILFLAKCGVMQRSVTKGLALGLKVRVLHADLGEGV